MKLIFVLLLVGIAAFAIPETSSASLEADSDALSPRKHHSHEEYEYDYEIDDGPGHKKPKGPHGPGPKKPKGPHGPGPKGPKGPKGPGPKPHHDKKPKGPGHKHHSKERHSHEVEYDYDYDYEIPTPAPAPRPTPQISAPAGIFVVFERLIVEFRSTIEIYVQDYARINRIEIDAVLIQFRSILETFEINVKQTIARACESRTNITIVIQQVQSLIVELQTSTTTIINRACGTSSSLIYQINSCFTSFNVAVEKYIISDVSQYTTTVTVTPLPRPGLDWTIPAPAPTPAPAPRPTPEISAPAGIFVVFERLIVEFRSTIEIYVQDYARINRIEVDAVLIQFRSILETFEINVKQTIARACESRTNITIVIQQVQSLIVELQTSTTTIITRACGTSSSLIYQINSCFASFNVAVEKYIVRDVSQYTTSITVRPAPLPQPQVYERPAREVTTVEVDSNDAILFIFEKLFDEFRDTIEVYAQEYARTNKVKLDSALAQFRSALESFEIDVKAVILKACEARIDINDAVRQIKSLIVGFQNTTLAIFTRAQALRSNSLSNNSLIAQINVCFDSFNATLIKYVTKIVLEITESTSTSNSYTETSERREDALSFLLVIVDKILGEVNVRVTASVTAVCSQSTVRIDVNSVLAQIQNAFVSFQTKVKYTLTNALRAKLSLTVMIQQIEQCIVEYQTNVAEVSYYLSRNYNVSSLNNQLETVCNTLSITIRQFLVIICGGSVNANSTVDLSGGIKVIWSSVKSLIAQLGGEVNSLLSCLKGSSSSRNGSTTYTTTWKTTTTTTTNSGGAYGLTGGLGSLLGGVGSGVGGLLG